ncbi:uncharacterized protein NPIL_100321 [Nephila pilipes]|uniref:DUF19 domain-containing protein n=1 Tax=Nephila pilipes TaxID=299642 RepID=A0A8X6T343_NEPPI|nr:uncharacterized protein NPIL_100321 [Nephila pilipes]
MLVFILILLGATEGLSETNDLCENPAYHVCFLTLPIRFPKSEEEINMICPPFLENQQCILSYARKCGEESIRMYDFTIERLQKMADIVKEICQMDSVLHSNVSDHIGCLHDVTEYDSSICYQTFRSRRENLTEYIHEKEGFSEYDERRYRYQHRLWRSYDCLYQSLFFTCYSAQTLEKCGAGAQELVLQLLYGVEYFEQFCPTSQREDVNELLKVMELDAEDERSLKELLAGQ